MPSTNSQNYRKTNWSGWPSTRSAHRPCPSSKRNKSRYPPPRHASVNWGFDAGGLGSATNPLRVAIVGSGPSGFYAAEALFKSPLTLRVDMIQRLPVPFGLVRYGVAPDQDRKSTRLNSSHT